MCAASCPECAGASVILAIITTRQGLPGEVLMEVAEAPCPNAKPLRRAVSA